MKRNPWLLTLVISFYCISSFGQIWVSEPSLGKMLAKQALYQPTTTKTGILINTQKQFQSIDGFGYTLTGGSAQLIYALEAPKRKTLLEELFGQGPSSIGISVLRIAVGASDLDGQVFSYDDVPSGQTDPSLKQFSLKASQSDLIPLMQEIKKINPKIKFMATPWSPPAWMKDNQSSKGGSLLAGNYEVYANYLVRYLREMKALGLEMDYLTPQNEPLHPGNNPSLLMLASEQNEFIKNHLGPAFQKA